MLADALLRLNVLAPDGHNPPELGLNDLAYPGPGGASIAMTAPDIRWIAARSEYWPSADRNPALSGSNNPDPWFGVTCLAFGIGAAGADWITRLGRSEWFAGLEPRMEDLAVAGGVSAGRWTAPVGSAGSKGPITAEVEAFVARARFPNAPLATIAVPQGAGTGDLAVALGLVSALRKRRDARGCRTAVIVTVEAGMSPGCSGFVRELLDRGAFVVQAGLGASGDHLHHFPLRSTIVPRRGRLVCVDLADHLTCWRPGSAADLHVIPSGFDDAARVLSLLPVPNDAGVSGIRALNLHLHPDLNARGTLIVEIDRLATHCRELFLGSDGNMVFTTADRMDGVTGSADLLVIHEARVPPVTSASVADAAHCSRTARDSTSPAGYMLGHRMNT